MAGRVGEAVEALRWLVREQGKSGIPILIHLQQIGGRWHPDPGPCVDPRPKSKLASVNRGTTFAAPDTTEQRKSLG